MALSDADQANQRMVDHLITEGALWSAPLITAFRQTPRHHFLHHVLVYQQRHEGWREVDTRQPGAAEIDLLYSDRALITRLGQNATGVSVPISSSSQPSLMAEMLEDLRPALGQQVLEIGAGTGYNAALLAHVVGAGLVHSVDVDREVLAEAQQHLDDFPERGVQLHHGDGRAGWPPAAPFDRVMVTAATPDLEPAWLAQLKEGGALVAPVVFAPGMAFVVRGVIQREVFVGQITRGAYFMPLRTEAEAPQDDSDKSGSGGPWLTRPAPWADWLDRQRPRLGWSSVLQAVAFYGWVRGLQVRYRGSASGGAGFGVACDQAVCWFGPDDWQVNGPAGQELGEAIWQAWLRAGGPWPTEFRLTVAANGGPDLAEQYYRRPGPRCQQCWELVETRERPGWRSM
jgi:protein-L-isoaspartate(D-aspartate) O-methyltransferase